MTELRFTDEGTVWLKDPNDPETFEMMSRDEYKERKAAGVEERVAFQRLGKLTYSPTTPLENFVKITKPEGDDNAND